MGGNIGPELIRRAERCCCKMCGAPIKPKLVLYDRYGGHGVELYCEHCQKIEYGTEPEIFQLAQKFIETFEFNYFPEMEENERCEQLNVAKMCDIISWIFEEIDLLDDTGVNLNVKKRSENNE